MRILIQRVIEASVTIEGEKLAKIGKGLLVFCGIEEEDTIEDLQWCTSKLLQLRIFNDDMQKMNFDIQQVKGSLLVVSQFTLHASTRKGNRPSFIKAAKPDIAEKLFQNFLEQLKLNFSGTLASGIFGADMKVALINDGPVTIWMDSKNKE